MSLSEGDDQSEAENDWLVGEHVALLVGFPWVGESLETDDGLDFILHFYMIPQTFTALLHFAWYVVRPSLTIVLSK